MTEHGGYLFKNIQKARFFDCKEHKKVKSPKNKVPRSAVPKTRKKPNNQKVSVCFKLAFSVAAERNVNIISEKRAQRNVPAPPKVRDGICNVGVVEILFEFEAYHIAHTDCHIGICRKIKINLKHIEYNAEPQSEHRAPRKLGYGVCGTARGKKRIRHKKRVRKRAAKVCYERFFCKSHGKARYAGADKRRVNRTLFNFVINVLVTNNRARNTLIKKARIKKQKEKVFLRGYFFSVNVDNI